MEVENGEAGVEEQPDSSLLQPSLQLQEDQDNKRRVEENISLQNNKRMKPDELWPQEMNQWYISLRMLQLISELWLSRGRRGDRSWPLRLTFFGQN